MAYQFYRISVLVVEDNQPMLEITKALLITFGVGEVITAQNGEEGFRAFCEHNPDIIIADWMMKPTDGIAFTKMVRSNPDSPNPYAPIILMTGFSEKRRVLQARDAGVTEFLVKPFTARDLYKRIAQIIERPRQFVKAENFFGPDRRRSRNQTFTGPFRRESDFDNPIALNWIREQERVEQEAHAILKRIRDDAGLEKGEGFDLKPDSMETADK